MNTVFVSFDFENDRHYKYLLEAWHANPKFQFVFEDGTPREIDSYNVGRIKAALTSKVKAATHTLVIVGKYANQRHPKSHLIGYRNWINFEIHQSVQEGKQIAVIRLDRSNELPEELNGVQYSLVEGFSESNVMQALNSAPYQYSRYGLKSHLNPIRPLQGHLFDYRGVCKAARSPHAFRYPCASFLRAPDNFSNSLEYSGK